MSQMELVDCHTHTFFSDGKSSLEENFAACLSRNITTIACTDHWGKPDFIDCSIQNSKLKDYETSIRTTSKQFPELNVICGIEADWYKGCEEDLKLVRSSFSFILGSIHYIDEKAIDWNKDMRIWEELGANELWKRYVDEWCKAATSGLFDSMAHPDLPRLFSNEGYKPTIDLAPLWNEMAQAAQEGNIRVEINTAGLTKSFNDFYPCESLLRYFAKAHVGITVGSDAHSADRIGNRIIDAYRYAVKAGFSSIDVPTPQGTWRTISLNDSSL